jgi:hypothetical protein
MDVALAMNIGEISWQAGQVFLHTSNRLRVGPGRVSSGLLIGRLRDPTVNGRGGNLSTAATRPVDDEVACDGGEIRSVFADAVKAEARTLAKRARERFLHKIGDVIATGRLDAVTARIAPTAADQPFDAVDVRPINRDER